MAGATLPLSADSYTGRKMGKYEVLCRLSTGGMSEIFLAFQRGLAGFRKLVVLKSILPDISGEEEFVRMFLDEARITAAFNHPNIAQVFDLDIDDGALFLSMEFVPGATLVEIARACRANNEPIPIGLTLAAVRDTALALHYAHNFTDPLGRKQVVIHRDVAEKNIMVTYEGTTKLLDFGIAKSLSRASRTTVGMVKGTSGYMSPEQILGEPLDARSDIFSLGVVLHECLTGMRLFHGKNPEEGMMAALKEDVIPPSRQNPQVPPELDQVVLKALNRKRDDRWTNALEFARAIDRTMLDQIWNPEQSGELVQRLFSDRRTQTRTLLSRAQSDEVTGETRLKGLLDSLINGAKPEGRRTNSGSAVVSPVVTPLPSYRGKQVPDRTPEQTEPTPLQRPSAPPGRTVRIRGKSGETPLPPEPASDGGRDSPTLPPMGPGERTVVGDPSKTLSDEVDDQLEPELKTVPAAAIVGLLPPHEKTVAVSPEQLLRGTLASSDRTALAPPTPPMGNARPSRADRTEPGGKPLNRSLMFGLGLGVALVISAVVVLLWRVSQPSTPPAPKPVGPARAEQAVQPPPAPKDEPAPVPAAVIIAEAPQAPEPPSTEVAAAPIPEAPAAPHAALDLTPEPEKKPAPVAVAPKPPARRPTPKVEARAAPESKSAGAGTIRLVTSPPDATVMFRSKSLGITPLIDAPLPAGKHTLKLIGSDKKTYLLPVEIADGKPTKLRVDLSELQTE